MMFSFLFVLCMSTTGTFAQVTLTLAKEPACSGEDLTFTCEDLNQSGLLVWAIKDLPGVPNTSDAFASSLSNIHNRIASPDSEAGPNPSIIMIQSVQAIDSGATIQCGVINMESSNISTLSIRKLLNCTSTMSAIHIGISSITVNWTQPTCNGVMPMHYLVQLTPGTVSMEIATSINSFNIPSLESDTSYNITLLVVDVCGRMAAASLSERTTIDPTSSTVSSTPSTTATSTPTTPTTPSGGAPPTPPNAVIIGSVVAGLIVVALVVISAVVAVLIFKHMKKNQTHGEKLTARRGEEMVDMREDTTYAAPDKDKTAAESGDGGGVYSYAATTTVVGAKHAKPGGEKSIAEDVCAQPEKPLRGSKKHPPPADVPHKQGPVGDLYAMPDKKAPEVGHKSGPQGDMYAVAAKPSKGGYGAEGPN